MVIYLTHPVHGTKVATQEAEAVYDEANGWKRTSINEIPAIEQSESSIEREQLTKRYVEKFGKKPHWKSSIETIKSELEKEEPCQPPST